MSRRRATQFGIWVFLFLLGLGAVIGSGTVIAQTETPDDAGWGEMTPERRAEAIAYSHTKNVFYFVTTAYSVIVLLVILYTGFSGRLLSWAEKLGRGRVLTLAAYVALFLATIAILEFPFSWYLGYQLEHAYGLSNQSLGAWLGDEFKGLAISYVLLTIIVGVAYALIRRRAKTWWLWVGASSIPFIVFLVILSPVVITPLFYDVTEMDDSTLKTQILDLAGSAGIDESRVFVMDASKNTKKLNAYVTGLRGTKRIVLYDNLIANLTPEEVLFVVGHEMGHYLMHHMWIGLGLAVGLVFLFTFLMHRLADRLIAAQANRFGFDRLSSFASLPLVYLMLTVFLFVATPFSNAISRNFETAADEFGLDQTGNGVAAEGAFEKLAQANLSNPSPSTFIKLWRFTHPPLSERVLFARAYDAQQGGGGGGAAATDKPAEPLLYPGEKHFANIRQLTDGGENAECYFNTEGDWFVFQATRDDWPCDRIFTMNTRGEQAKLLSEPGGVTTCAFWSPDGERIIYASTYLVDDSCPPRPDYSQGYVWSLYKGYDVFSVKPDGTDLVQLTKTPGYDAEAVYAPDGSKILFTSVRNGDLDLYTMSPDGSNVTQLTHELGYDGGAFYSADGTKIIYRAHHPTDSASIADYQNLLMQGLIRPSVLEIFIMDADGSNKKQITNNGAANFCPYFHPDGRRVIFASNMDDPRGHNFDLYMINIDGTGLERITYNESFDGFPMFSKDGKQIVFCSNRFNAKRGETNVFIADWID